jgi:oligopeptide/dipeptide ABC transporter ATP-binding protein
MSSLNPAMRIGIQLTEKVEIHNGMARKAAMTIAADRLSQTHIAGAPYRLRQYPHEFSGGMRQRAMIAMGLMTEPDLIVADEPTTALDVTVQAQILDLLRQLNKRSDTAVLFISHDLAVVAEICSRVLVIYAGHIVEELSTEELKRPAHPYTRALLGAVVDLEVERGNPLVTVPGEPPRQATVGCPFAPRCNEAIPRCFERNPSLMEMRERGHSVACWARVADGSVVADVQVS